VIFIAQRVEWLQYSLSVNLHNAHRVLALTEQFCDTEIKSHNIPKSLMDAHKKILQENI